MSKSEPIFTEEKIIKAIFGQRYVNSTIQEKNVVSVIHIYGAIAHFLLICDHQDTAYE